MSGVPRLKAREPLVGHTRRVSCVALAADGIPAMTRGAPLQPSPANAR